jgi:OmpA-OmpF porin, OOP family
MRNVLLALLAVSSLASAHDNWTSQAGSVVNSTGLCWRDSAWTPATSAPECDGALQPVAPKSVTTKPAPVNPAVKTVQEFRITYKAQSLFDFDRAVIKHEGRAELDQLVTRLKTVNTELIIAVGHTDSVGSDTYNLQLGQRRAEAVKQYLVSQGLEAGRVYTDSKGEREPVADNKTSAGRSRNRRVVVEVYGTAK